jgi:hypothetical protein
MLERFDIHGFEQKSRRIIIRGLSSVVVKGVVESGRLLELCAQPVDRRHWSALVANRKARESKQRMIRSKLASFHHSRHLNRKACQRTMNGPDRY